jgi:hypothetical protein
MSLTRILVLIGLISLAVGCGGGGGGGGGAGNGVRVLNGAIDAYPIDIVSSATSVATARFSFASNRVAWPGDNENVLIARTGTVDQPIFSIGDDGIKRKSVLIYGNRLSVGLRKAEFDDDFGKIPSGQSAIRVVHSLIGASSIAATLGGSDFGKIGFGGASTYQYIDAGTYPLKVKRVADALTVFSGSKAFQAGRAYTLMITGEAGYLVLASQLVD